MVFQRLCDVLLTAGRLDDSQANAMIWLNAASSPEEQTSALRALGRCLERKGDRINAALCFAGSTPHLESTPVPLKSAAKEMNEGHGLHPE
jgi:hypothetical protein